jgi:hypothetical protein
MEVGQGVAVFLLHRGVLLDKKGVVHVEKAFQEIQEARFVEILQGVAESLVQRKF